MQKTEPNLTLTPDYYLDNFLKLHQHATEWYSDLLSAQEQHWLDAFSQLSHASQCLLVRMLSRKGHWFRSDKLSYAEIGELQHPLSQLSQFEFIRVNPSISRADLAQSLLTKPELLTLDSSLDKRMTKQQAIEQFSEGTDIEHPESLALNFQIIELLHPRTIDVLLLLFFANTHQDLSQFVLTDIGLHRFEAYDLSKERRFFKSHDHIEQRLSLSELYANYQLTEKRSLALIELLEQLPEQGPFKDVNRRREQIINLIARDLERLGEVDQALKWFQQSTLPPSRERQARMLEPLNQLDMMQAIISDMRTNPKDIGEWEVAEKLQHRLDRKRGLKVTRSQKPKHTTLHLDDLDLSQTRVELAVLNRLTQDGWRCFYSENTLLNGLFGLLFWEVIFAPVEGAFINPYQHRPLDLYHSDFVAKREAMVQHALDSLETLSHQAWVDRYHRKYGISNPFVNWNLFSQDLLIEAITYIPTSTLRGLFEILLTDLARYRSGMPDLIAFKDGQYQWVEVKGPGDKVQDNQWRWFRHFEQLGVPFSVCYVNQGAKSQ
ncbi:VRR-NUC domain-containing protein [Vibrio sp. AK197]